MQADPAVPFSGRHQRITPRPIKKDSSLGPIHVHFPSTALSFPFLVSTHPSSGKPTGTNIMGRRPHDLTQFLRVIEYPCPLTQQQGLHARLRSETCFPTHWLGQHLNRIPCIDPIYIFMDSAIHDMHGTVCFFSPASTFVTEWQSLRQRHVQRWGQYR